MVFFLSVIELRTAVAAKWEKQGDIITNPSIKKHPVSNRAKLNLEITCKLYNKNVTNWCIPLPGLVMKSQCGKPAMSILFRNRTKLVRLDSWTLAGISAFISLCVNSSGYKQKIFPGREFRKIAFSKMLPPRVATLIALIIRANGFKFWANISTWWRHAQNLFMHLCLTLADRLG